MHPLDPGSDLLPVALYFPGDPGSLFAFISEIDSVSDAVGSFRRFFCEPLTVRGPTPKTPMLLSSMGGTDCSIGLLERRTPTNKPWRRLVGRAPLLSVSRLC